MLKKIFSFLPSFTAYNATWPMLTTPDFGSTGIVGHRKIK